MKKPVLILITFLFIVGQSYAQSNSYVGPETCLSCHTGSFAPDATGWRQTLHANGYSAVLNDTYSMVVKKGIVADYNQNKIDDFKDGLDFNKISSVFDPYKPNAPILGYSDSTGYTITIGDLTNRVYLTYGGSGMWKQRYAVRIKTTEGESKDFYISPIQYNEVTHQYVLYHADAWYDANNKPIYSSISTLSDASQNSRSLAKGCAGCHVTGLTLSKTTNGEWVAHGAGVNNESAYKNNPSYFDLDQDGKLDQMNTGCERCHGPGGNHVASGGDTTKIINPEKLTVEQANNLCGMCHSRGHSKPNGTFSFPYDDQNMTSWETGDLVDTYYADAGGYWGDEINSKKHHQQFEDFYKSTKPTFKYHKVACYNCHDPHSSKQEHQIVTEINDKDANGNPIVIPTQVDNNTLCLACHATHGDFQNITKTMVMNYADNKQQIGQVVSQHTHHPYDPEGTTASSRCITCHMPKIAKSAINYDIHSHTFEAIPPEKTINYQMPNSCAVSCHNKTGYPNFGVDIANDNFSDWSEPTDIALSDSLMHYYGPNGVWWNTITSVALSDFNTPIKYEISQNYPNPFNPTTMINFSVSRDGNVNITVYDALGKAVEVLVDGYKQAGNYRVIWNASRFASGIYFYRMRSNNFTQIRKMILMK